MSDSIEYQYEEIGYEETNVDDFIINLPKVKSKKKQFLLKIDWEDEEIIYAAVRELFWHEMLDAEAQAFRAKSEDEMYLSGEHERREILKKAIVWIAVIPSCEFMDNEDGRILSKVNFDVIEAIWSQYQTFIFLGATEASALYNAAVKYYNGDSQTNSPVPSVILEVDMMLKFGGMTRKELRKITAIEMEKMQTIFMARAEALGLGVRKRVEHSYPKDDLNEMDDSMLNTLPPGMREMTGQFLGGRPPDR